MFASRLGTRVFSVLFSFVNYILSSSWSRYRVIFSKLLSEPACSSQVDLHWASPHLPRGMQRISGPFILKFILEILSYGMFFCSIYIETAQNSRVECNEFADLLFWRLSLCLSRDSLSCDTRSLDLSILFKFIFLYLFIHSTPFLPFSHILLNTIILRILPRETFFLSLVKLLLAI